MIYSFKARIYKTGINCAVDVTPEITTGMMIEKGYIRVKELEDLRDQNTSRLRRLSRQ
jgi:hypothetical protein